MSNEDPRPNSADDEPAEEIVQVAAPDSLDVPFEADEADVIDQEREVPPPGNT